MSQLILPMLALLLQAEPTTRGGVIWQGIEHPDLSKFLVIAALFALLLLLLYSRLYPYIEFLKKILGIAKKMADSPPNRNEVFGKSTGKADGKLVRCVGCGTWIPAERALGMGTGPAVYCSRECIEKPTASDERKAAS